MQTQPLHDAKRPLASRGAVRLISGFDPLSNHFRGTLVCSIFVPFSSAAPLVVDEMLGSLVMGDVLNPFGRVMLADEVQRMMRVGLGQWLVGQLSASDATEVEHLTAADAAGSRTRVFFGAPMPNGHPQTLPVDVAGAADDAQAVMHAMHTIQTWAAQQDRRPVHADLLPVLRGIDSRRAFNFCHGMALSGHALIH